MKAGDHGPDQRYNKFRVEKVSSGYVLDYEREFYFVLRPETADGAAIAALQAYADECEAVYPQLARDIWEQVDRIQHGVSLDPERPLPTTPAGWKLEQGNT